MSSMGVEHLRAGHESFNRRDFDAMTEFMALDCVVVDHARGERIQGPAAFAQWALQFVGASSDIKLVDARYFDAGEWVTSQFRAVGTQDGPLGAFPATSKPFSLDVCEVWHFRPDGRANEGHNYSDVMSLLVQLGHVPVAA